MRQTKPPHYACSSSTISSTSHLHGSQFTRFTAEQKPIEPYMIEHPDLQSRIGKFISKTARHSCHKNNPAPKARPCAPLESVRLRYLPSSAVPIYTRLSIELFQRMQFFPPFFSRSLDARFARLFIHAPSCSLLALRSIYFCCGGKNP